MIRIGLTGGIGSGKSTAALYFRELYSVDLIDADSIAHSLTAENGAALPAILESFGKSVFNQNLTLNRTLLRERIFRDTDARKTLEGIIHPLVYSEILQRDKIARKIKTHAAIFDIPLLAENLRWRYFFDKILVIDCCKATQIQRIHLRNGLSTAHAEEIISAQATRVDRLSASDAVIYNGGASTLEKFRSSVHKLGSIWNLCSLLK